MSSAADTAEPTGPAIVVDIWDGLEVEVGVGALTDAQRDALRRLVDGGVLSPEQREAVETAFASAAARRDGPARWLVEVAGYVGGGLMLGGVTLFLDASWDHLAQAARSALLAAFALAFALAGVLVAGGPRQVRRLATNGSATRRRLVGVLFGLAAVTAALSTGVGMDRYSGSIGGLVGVAVAAAGMLLVPTVAGLVATAVMSLVAVTQAGDEVAHASALGIGLLLVALGLAWIAAAALRRLPSKQVGLAVGAGYALTGAQWPLVDGSAPWAYGLTFALAVGCFLLYRWLRSVVLLVAGVFGTTLAVPEAVVDWTDGALSGSVVLLMAGAVLVAASAIGLRIRHAGALTGVTAEH